MANQSKLHRPSGSKLDQTSKAQFSKGPAGLVIVGNVAAMIEAAKTNPHMAKALASAETVSNKMEARTEGAAEDVDLGHELELWKDAMRFEANREGAEEAFERAFADQLAGIELEEEPVMTPHTAVSGSKEFAGSEVDQGSSSTHARGAGLGKVASHWVRALGEAEQEKDDQAGNPGSDNLTKAAHGITTAQILEDAVFEDKIPSDPLTREHFGFSKVNSCEEESCLLGLYQGLLLHLAKRPTLETVQGWQRKNKLAGGIYHCYKSQEADSGYFRWFKKNQHVFSQDYKRAEGVWAPVERPTSVDYEKLRATCRPKRNNKRSKA